MYDEKFVKWSVADLPILPKKWQYLVSASTKKQFGILKKLMNRPDVDRVTAATDAGREGELIFRLVYQQTGCKKPVFRLWLSSMEEAAIREGFANLKPSTEYDALYNAALCRERADWMVGINASRLFSCLYGRPLAVDRVMTPVLAMTVVREAVPHPAGGFRRKQMPKLCSLPVETRLAPPCRMWSARRNPKIRRSFTISPRSSGMPIACWGLRRSRP